MKPRRREKMERERERGITVFLFNPGMGFGSWARIFKTGEWSDFYV